MEGKSHLTFVLSTALKGASTDRPPGGVLTGLCDAVALAFLVGREASKSCDLWGQPEGQDLYGRFVISCFFGERFRCPHVPARPPPTEPETAALLHPLLTGLRARKCVCIPPQHRTQCPVLFLAFWSWESLLAFSHFLPLNIRNIRFQK